MLAPIILFVYNRLWHTRQTVEALQKNELVTESELYVFCDGPKESATDEQREKVHEVQEYVQSITGFKKLHIKVQESNMGLANSVINGVTEVVEKYGKVIVVEDDIVTHPFFLRFMNDCLNVYEDRLDIFMIGGYNPNIKFPSKYKDDLYVVHRSCSWGWATWRNRWILADWNVSDYYLMCENQSLQNRFNRGGGDMFPMLKAQMDGKIDSWAIRWDYSMYKHDALCVRPVKSLCSNCGLDGSGVHCGFLPDNYTAPLYASNDYKFHFNKNVTINSKIAKEFAYYQQHGGKHLPDHVLWLSIKQRCYFIRVKLGLRTRLKALINVIN